MIAADMKLRESLALHYREEGKYAEAGSLYAAAAQPENPTAKAEQGSFNKSETGLAHQSDAAWIHDGPASPHAEWDQPNRPGRGMPDADGFLVWRPG